jgi:hypothetical protein
MISWINTLKRRVPNNSKNINYQILKKIGRKRTHSRRQSSMTRSIDAQNEIE